MVLLGVVDDRALELAEKMSRTTRTDRSASWKTSAGAVRLLDALLEHLVELEQVLQLALEVGALGALGGGADDRAAALEVELAASLRSRSRSVSSSRRETPTPSPVGA